MMGKEISNMSPGEAPRRMHDRKAHLTNLFVQKHVKFHYSHEDERDDSIYRKDMDFQEALSKIVDPDVKAHVFKYQKDLKGSTLRFKNVKLSIEENLQR